MKRKRLYSFVCSILTAASILVASESVFPLGASATDNQLNLRIFMCTTMCNNFHDYLDSSDIAYGTYGVPTSFTTRLSAITNYVYGYYMNSGAYVHTIFSSTDGMLTSPARDCADNAAAHNTTSLNVIANGCPCYTDDACFNYSNNNGGNLHHNNLDSFVGDLPDYDPENECAVYLTASRLCSNNFGYHHNVYGVCSKDDMYIIAADSDYRKSHGDDTSTTFAYAYARNALVHEVGHLFNVADHYSDVDYIGPTLDPDCVWGVNHERYDNVRNCTTCGVCHSTIVNNNDIYHHSS